MVLFALITSIGSYASANEIVHLECRGKQVTSTMKNGTVEANSKTGITNYSIDQSKKVVVDSRGIRFPASFTDDQIHFKGEHNYETDLGKGKGKLITNTSVEGKINRVLGSYTDTRTVSVSVNGKSSSTEIVGNGKCKTTTRKF